MKPLSKGAVSVSSPFDRERASVIHWCTTISCWVIGRLSNWINPSLGGWLAVGLSTREGGSSPTHTRVPLVGGRPFTIYGNRAGAVAVSSVESFPIAYNELTICPRAVAQRNKLPASPPSTRETVKVPSKLLFQFAYLDQIWLSNYTCFTFFFHFSFQPSHEWYFWFYFTFMDTRTQTLPTVRADFARGVRGHHRWGQHSWLYEVFAKPANAIPQQCWWPARVALKVKLGLLLEYFFSLSMQHFMYRTLRGDMGKLQIWWKQLFV